MSMQRDLWYVVASVKADLQIEHTKYDIYFFKWAVDGFRDLNRAGVLNTYLTKRLPVNADNSVDFPSDYEDFTKIGLCINGYIVNFTANQNICLAPPKLNCCLETVTAVEGACKTEMFGASSYVMGEWWDASWYYIPTVRNGQFVAGLYGRGEGFYNAGYRINEEKNQIQFDQFLKCKEIVLEYKSSGDIESGNAYIPSYSVNALRHYVHWQRCMFSKNPIEKRDTDMHRRRYQKDIKRIVAQVNGMTASEILDIIRSSFHQLPKR